jgi:hypothetical protein
MLLPSSGVKYIGSEMGLVIKASYKEGCLDTRGVGVKEGAWSKPMGRNGQKLTFQGAHSSSSEVEYE